MPALFVYLIKVNVALLIFCAGYYAVLRHLTFYNLNRVYLVTAIIFSTLYPKIDLVNFLNRHEEIAKPMQVVVLNWQQPVKEITKTILGHDVWFWLQAAFWLGVVLFAFRLLTQLLSLYRLHKRSEPAQIQQFMIRAIKGNINPFSFWRNIYINPENHPAQELGAILAHEQIHVSEWHTLDILLGEVSAVFYWFNPGVWLMKRAIRENIEFITDSKILQKGVDCKAYQYSLLTVNFGAEGNAIVNHFNISTIKKRIMMMNAKRSSKVSITRYLFLIPAVMVLLLVFSVSKAEMNKVVKSSKHMISDIKTAITKISFTAAATTTANAPVIAGRAKMTLLTAINMFTVHSDSVDARTDSPSVKKMMFTGHYKINDIEKQEVFFASADTDKKVAIKLRGMPTGAKPDIYINGVKTEAGLESVNPDDISSVSVIKDATAPPNGAIYIETKSRQTSGLRTDTILVKSVNGKVAHVSLTKPSDVSDKEVTVVGYPTKITNIRLNGKTLAVTDPNARRAGGHDTVYTGVTVIGSKRLDTLLKKLPDMEVMTDGTMLHKVVAGTAIRQAITVQGYPMHNSAASIKLSDKLIIINGKEASAKELKKISADKIESVSNLSAESAKTLYGDKAKNGVVVITTKK